MLAITRTMLAPLWSRAHTVDSFAALGESSSDGRAICHKPRRLEDRIPSLVPAVAVLCLCAVLALIGSDPFHSVLVQDILDLLELPRSGVVGVFVHKIATAIDLVLIELAYEIHVDDRRGRGPGHGLLVVAPGDVERTERSELLTLRRSHQDVRPLLSEQLA